MPIENVDDLSDDGVVAAEAEAPVPPMKSTPKKKNQKKDEVEQVEVSEEQVEAPPRKVPPKAKASKAKAKPKAKASGKDGKAKAASSQPPKDPKVKAKAKAALKRPAAVVAVGSAADAPPVTESPQKKPAIRGQAEDDPSKRRVNKYIYHRDGVWGIKVNKSEWIRVRASFYPTKS